MTHAAHTPVATKFRFYGDGTEAASSPLAAENVNISVDVSAGDVQVQFRSMVEETGGADGATTDDWGCRFNLNAVGYIDLGAATTGVHADATSALTGGSATTNRATNGIADPGTGTFDAGEQVTGGASASNRQLLSGNFMENVWGLLLVSAELANGDTIDFEVSYNAGTPGMTNSVNGRITIVKSAGSDTPQAATISGGATVAASLAVDFAVTAAVATGAAIVASRQADYLRSASVSSGAAVAAVRVADYLRSSTVSGGASIATLVSKTFDIAANVAAGASIASVAAFSAGVLATVSAGASVVASRLVDYVRAAAVAAGAAVAVTKDIGLSAGVSAGPAVAASRIADYLRSATMTGGATIAALVSLTFDVAAAVAAGASVVASNVFAAGSGGGPSRIQLVRGVVRRLARGVARSIMRRGDQ